MLIITILLAIFLIYIFEKYPKSVWGNNEIFINVVLHQKSHYDCFPDEFYWFLSIYMSFFYINIPISCYLRGFLMVAVEPLVLLSFMWQRFLNLQFLCFCSCSNVCDNIMETSRNRSQRNPIDLFNLAAAR